LILLGIDPGSANCGFSIIQTPQDDPHYSFIREAYLEKPDIIKHGFLVKTHQFCQADYLDRSLIRQAIAEVLGIIQDHGIDAVGFERWMARPGRPVPGWVERLNYVLGALYYAVPCKLYSVQASAWKKRFLNRYGIESTQTFFGGELKSEHEADASMIAAYVWETNFRIEEKKVRKKKEG
jgi:hypothetical protein